MDENVYDLIIVGAGPAGLSAAIYANRARLNTIVLEENRISGGQIINTYDIDNYLGFPGINGFDLAARFREHANEQGIKFITGTVTALNTISDLKNIVCSNEEYYSKSVIIASGARYKKLGVPGEEKLGGRGVSYCAACDGAFFKSKTVAVVGSGDSAAEEAIYLSSICEKVYMIHKNDELEASKILQEKLFSLKNIEIINNSSVQEIIGEELVEGLQINRIQNEKSENIKIIAEGVFIAVGFIPNSSNFSGAVEIDEKGFILAEEEGITSAEGIFAAGDVRTKGFRQIVTAVSDGANAAYSAEKYLGTLLN